MNKYGIITHYDVHNHGAILQLTALIRVLKVMGIEATALQFEKNYDFLGHTQRAKYDISIKSVGIFASYLISQGISKTLYNYKKRRTLNNFKKDEKLLGNYYCESEKLDGVIIGSDEVFALHTGPTPVFFGHCLPTDKVISYAASFGPTTFQNVIDLKCESLISSGLCKMEYITVRDENSASIVEKLINNRPQIVVDPVLLYGYKNELNKTERPLHEKYLLIYAYDNRMNDEEEILAIKQYAKSKKLTIVSAGFYHKWCDKNINVDPIELLGYFKYAECIITDTFHGCIMSIIAEAMFAVRTRESNTFKIKSLLDEFGLSQRIFTKWNALISTLEIPIDYKIANTKIESCRQKSLDILKIMIK